MKKQIKKLIRPAYKVYVKSSTGRKMRDSAKPAFQAYVKNNKIIISTETHSNFDYTLTVCDKKYKFENGSTSLPFTPEYINALKSGEYSVATNAYFQNVVFSSDELIITPKDEVVQIENTNYSVVKDAYISLQFERKDNDLYIHTTLCTGSSALDEPLKLFVIDQNYNVLISVSVSNDCAILKDIDTLLASSEQVQLIFASDKNTFIPVPKYFSDDTILIKNDFSGLYLKKTEKSFTYPAKGLDEAISDLKPKYVYISSVAYAVKDHVLTIKFKKTIKKCSTFVLYLRSLKTDERELLVDCPVKKQISIDNIDEILDRDINLIDRYVFEFELKNENGKVLERNWLRISQPKTRNINDYILYAAHENRLGFLDKHTLLVENENNHFTYEETYDFDLENHTFSTDCSVSSDENGNVLLQLKIYSLLSKVTGYTIYLTDNYAKKTYCFYECTLPEASRTINDTILIDMDKLNSYLYYNARLNFRIGIQYNGGYRECGFLTKKRDIYGVKERYLYTHKCSEGLVSSFYLGANLYNLNVWHTSEDEYEKSIDFQIGREKYFETLQNEDVDENLIIFEANLGKNYTGNPKYLYEYMLRTPEYAGFKFVWAYPDTESTKIPGNPILAKRGSAEYFYYLAKAKYWVNNILFPVKEKREETVYLQTWHGTPLKKLGFDIECEGPEKQSFGNLHKESLNWDYLLVDNDYGEEKLVNAFRFKKKVIKEGYPINDIFYNEDLKNAAKERLLHQYPTINGKKVILYAPTWRDLQGDYVRGYDFSLPFDVAQLYNNFNDEYVILVKLHHLISDSLVIDDAYKDFLINVSNEEDIMELLCITDILITDYSSVFYDFASAKKPILFYMYDLDEYMNETRGLYVGIDTLPGPILANSDELNDAISNIENYKYETSEKLQSFCNEMAKYCNGHSCEKVLNIVLKERKND